jgi:PTS system nitrogen regulatory IIA component
MDDIFKNATVLPDLEVTSKRRALKALADAVAEAEGIDSREVMDHLLERERLGATGVGHGVAMPHGRMEGLERLAIGFARLKTPVEYESPDGEPVDLILLLLAPEEAGAVCLKALSRASRLLRDPAIRQKLRDSTDAQEIMEIFKKSQAVLAA